MKIKLTAATSQHDRWGWGVPRDKTAAARFSVKATDHGRSLLVSDSSNHLANCFAFAQPPDGLSVGNHSGEAMWHANLDPQASLTVNYVLVIGKEDGVVHAQAMRKAARFDAALAQVQADWETRFQAMFTPDNRYFSGNLPVLVTPDRQMRRVYYMSAVTLLSVYRTGFPVQRRVYVSNTPESNCTMMYFWDTREWATAFALLDPEMLKNCLRSWLARDIDKGYAEEYLTGTLQGPWYSANDYSIFILLDDYLNVTGDRAFLSEKIDGKTVLEHLDAVVTHWRSRVHPGRTLADYGKASNLLECVPTYINEVPSFNAANVRMMRRAAELQAAGGNQRRAAELRAEATRLLPAVLASLQAGTRRLGLVAQRRQARGNAPRAGFHHHRPDHQGGPRAGSAKGDDGLCRARITDRSLDARRNRSATWRRRFPTGPTTDRWAIFSAWPGETIATFCEFGEFDKALDFLHGIAAVTNEGPFSQSRELMGRTRDAAVRIAERSARGNPSQTYNASNGGSFAESIIRGFFGYQPDLLAPGLVPDAPPAGSRANCSTCGRAGALPPRQHAAWHRSDW